MSRPSTLSGHESEPEEQATAGVGTRPSSATNPKASDGSVRSDARSRHSRRSSAEQAPASGSSLPQHAVDRDGKSDRNGSTARPHAKRRRLDADLGFSSPGPAFRIVPEDDTASSSGAESNGNGRPRRARRSVIGSGSSNKDAAQSSPVISKSRLQPIASVANPRKASPAKADSTSGRDGGHPARGRSRSSALGSANAPEAALRNGRAPPTDLRDEVADEPDDALASDNDGKDPGASATPLAVDRGPRTRITPITASTAQRPFDEILALRRQERLQASQEALEDVHDDHDMLVRELFHLVKFVTLIGYDPEVAKQDRSDVFSQFQQEHDLRFALEADGAGPSGSRGGRVTRRGVNARLEGLSLKRAQPPATPVATAATEQPTSSTSKRRESSARLSRRSASLAFDDADDSAGSAEPGPSTGGKRKANHRDGESKKQGRARTSANGRIVELADSPSTARDRRSSFGKKGKARRRDDGAGPPLDDDLDEFIRRHRQPRALPDTPPPIRALAPQHIPQPPAFRGSVCDLWASFRYVDDEELDPRQADEAEQELLEAYLRVDRGRRSGLMALDDGEGHLAHLRPHKAPRSRDRQDHLLEAMVSMSQQMRQNHKQRITLAKRVSRMVAAYWDRQSGSSERERRAEERRLRALAKWTVREVAKQWRLAANVVRARKAAREKAEKDKLDKEQLNAILEKSTQMLQKQHEEMARMDLGSSSSDSERSFYDVDEEEEEELEGDDGAGTDTDAGSQTGSESEAVSVVSAGSRLSIKSGGDGGRRLVEMLDNEETGRFTTPSPAPAIEEQATEARDEPPSLRGLDVTSGQEDSLSAVDEADNPSVGAMDRDDAADAPARRTPRTRRSTRSASLASSSAATGPATPDPDGEDVDFSAVDPEAAAEDEELERKMWEEDEADDSEDAGLAADADVPIEELLKRYGYGNGGEGTESVDATEDEEEGGENKEVAAAADTAAKQDLDITAADEPADAMSGIETPPLPTQSGGPPDDDSIRAEMAPTARTKTESIASDVESADEDEDEDEGEGEKAGEGAGAAAARSRSMTRASSSSVLHTPDRANSASASASGAGTGRSRQPFLLRGQLRPYQQIGFEWLAGLYANGVNGILADEMGLGKTIQTIALLAHLACDRGVWGPHLVVAPTSVMLNWEVEFKKFLPGFKILSYFGSQRERKEKRVGWNTENAFNVCITSYQLVLADQHIFRRKPWVYLVLDEAHHIKNFRSQRWQTLLGFNSQRRLLLTGTPLQNNLMDLWSLMYFLMPHGVADLPGGGAFASMKDFQERFSRPLDRAIEGGGAAAMDDEMRAMIHKLHTVLRPYLLRRLKSEVERELPSKYEHVIRCRLSKRQRFLYNDFMSRAKTRESLASGNYLSIINCLMQLRKVCNHPDLFEVRPIVTSFAMQRSAVADYEVKELLVRRRLLQQQQQQQQQTPSMQLPGRQGVPLDRVDLDAIGLRITAHEEEAHLTPILSRNLRRLDASRKLPFFREPARPRLTAGGVVGGDDGNDAKTETEAAARDAEIDTWSLDGFRRTLAQKRHRAEVERWNHAAYVNHLRCLRRPIYGKSVISLVRKLGEGGRLLPLEAVEADRRGFLDRCDNVSRLVVSNAARVESLQPTIDRFAFVTPRAVAVDMPRYALPGLTPALDARLADPRFDTLHPVAVKLHIAFPDASLLQYDCGKLQQLDVLMRRLKEGGHRILIFTQMTKVLDILEAFLNHHGYRYLRLDGATKVEQRQALTEKFNRDLRISAFILSTRSGGLGINLTGADTVLFYDLDWNAAIEAQCMDRAHRIGQTRDVHIYRFVSEHTIEENMLRKANQKRQLDSVVIQEGDFTTEKLVDQLGGTRGSGGAGAGAGGGGRERIGWRDMLDDDGAIEGVKVQLQGDGNGAGGAGGGSGIIDDERALAEVEDEEDRIAANQAREEMGMDQLDFGDEGKRISAKAAETGAAAATDSRQLSETPADGDEADDGEDEGDDDEDEGGTIDEYMLRFVEADWDHFA
ncbi:uncharacterized protein PFL1_05220 [Pseudozyma flocculosa PF-1]|uniref:Helicase SWR1 n=2 Tax=Pseudozyma flocculosa TaxID=84751 RepID=A0A5C3F5A1_9BASI|nr:uncharacterized protein PFL1_05220 [Pseudozyma flocculosa PF-1]EPQ27297.1 hypothetical protein PFL1_05220 [Pseudozyma flocculosa PF-1]SPO39668.1 related to SWR1 - DEAH-box protein, putative RNA helicase [Pseudozyma flocculosa]